MLKKHIQKIFEKVQVSSSCHQKCVLQLIDLYRKSPQDEFLETLLDFLKLIVSQSIDNSVYVKQCLTFLSHFCADVTKKEEKENEQHDLLTILIEHTLRWSRLNCYDVRFFCCYFIARVLQDIGEDVQLDINLIDEIQSVLLERMQETKVPIRSTAMSALLRLQDPQNFECPVIQTYLQALTSGSAQIRREATEKIAPNRITLNHIRDRIRDCDPSVRSVAFERCGFIGPLNFRIADKHLILLCGFKETNEKVKDKFVEYLLPKWLTAYKGDYLKFVGGLKLIADEEDINKMTYLSKELIKEFYQKHPIQDLIAALPINQDHVINIEELSNEGSLYWNILTGLLRDSENMDEYLNSILPDLTPFCNYIESFVKAKSSEKMDEWKYFEYQFDLLNLLEIAENYDFSDEVGRRNIHSLTMNILQSNSFTLKLTKKLVDIAQKCSSNIEFFTNDICQLISEIREPLMDEPLSQDQQREKGFKAAELRVKINVLKEHQTEAINQREYQKAQELDNEIMMCTNQLESLQIQTEKVRVTKSDNETLSRCLDILSSVLELSTISKLTPSLITCRDTFLVPLLTNQAVEIHWRVLKCLGLYSVIDKDTAGEYAKILAIPIATYRTVPVNNISALLQSIYCITDLIALYGVELINEDEEEGNTTSEQNGRRKLYNNESEEDVISRIDNMTLSYIFEVFLDMLDDERDELRHKAVLALTVLIKQRHPVTPTFLSRIFLKYFSPLTEKQDSRLQVLLGLLIDWYVQFGNSCEVLKDAIIPTLTSITRAPRTSPLVDIDVDNMLLLLSALMKINLQKDDLKILALDMFMKISETPNDKIVPYLTKFLLHLDLDLCSPASLTELLDRTEMLLENLSDKVSRKHIEKLMSKLRQTNSTITTEKTQETVNTTENEESVDMINGIPPNSEKETSEELQQTTTTTRRNSTSSVESEVLQEFPHNSEKGINKQPQQVKRKKNRNIKNCVVVLEKMGEVEINKKFNETTLHTIIETSMEMEVDNSLNISTATSSSNSSRASKASKASAPPRNSIVITETSDSDFSSDNGSTHRRSARNRKKRIL